MKITSVIIPKYPGETDAEYAMRKADMLAALKRAAPAEHRPPMAYVTHTPSHAFSDVTRSPPASRIYC